MTVNMAYYFLKHYYYLHGLGKPTWLDCDLVHVEDFSDQFTKIKNACLTVCSSPMHFFLSYWKEGYTGSFRMGVHLGTVCVTCCWALMLLAFVGGAMNMLWMAGLTSIMIIEKQGHLSEKFSGLVGTTLIGAASITLVLSIFLEVMI